MNVRTLTEKALLLSLTLVVASLSTPVKASESVVWDLTGVYANDEAWESALETAQAEITALPRLAGSLGDSSASLSAALNQISSLEKEIARLYVFTSLIFDSDQRDADAQARIGRSRTLYSNFEESISWLAPEILAIGDARIEAFISADETLAAHEFFVRDTLRSAPHTLDAKTEEILAQASLALSASEQIYESYANADIPWPTVTLSEGQEVTLSQAGYSLWRAAPNRDDRKLVFDTFWQTWNQYNDGMGATMAANIQSNVFGAKVRNHDSTLAANLFDDGLPPEVYTQLVTQVNQSLPLFHRYLSLRGRMLGVDDLRYFDIYPPLVEVDTGEFDLARSAAITFEALKPFGEDYLALLKQGLDGEWMHSHPAPGKRSGAYMNGSIYDVHPFVLLNHNDDYESLSTFAHEWGHAVHSLLAQKQNPYETASYSTFTAEMASTINEILLQEYMIENARSDEEKLFYLGGALENIRGTLFRQTMFAEFELAMHEAVEAGEPLTGPKLSEMYGELLKRYHGHELGILTIDDEYAAEWAFIPHFYYDFYVFQYATSITGAAWFAEQFLAGDEQVRDSFIRVLSAGGSDYAHNILRDEAGLDMTTAEAYAPVLRRMESLMDRIEALL
ncbi:MAG: oligoendopeptidase F family protein [Gammaproteobacteria bacterium]|jgi:oligoendopeptidase F|nr:oligoendopeptidase F family protein [Gammaproteobacteria bacterium]MDG1179996.1 oligoendopeptidase F family protein [Gammaproteobacteria bacterium]MDG1516373.1 oligoendopeptidase F family protein [Gammaproteobacteria bacterium]MDG1795701.1 oligoendopeptidase F family protein [Gammaproteobacteria bacterium]